MGHRRNKKIGFRWALVAPASLVLVYNVNVEYTMNGTPGHRTFRFTTE